MPERVGDRRLVAQDRSPETCLQPEIGRLREIPESRTLADFSGPIAMARLRYYGAG